MQLDDYEKMLITELLRADPEARLGGACSSLASGASFVFKRATHADWSCLFLRLTPSQVFRFYASSVCDSERGLSAT